MRVSRFLIVLVLGTWASTAMAGPDRASWLRSQRAQAHRALKRLGNTGSLTVHWPAHRSRPAMIRGLAVKEQGRDDVQRARNFVSRRPALFAGPGSRLVHDRTLHAGDLRVVRFVQVYKGVPVEDAVIAVAINRQGLIRSVNSELEPVTLRMVKPRVTAGAAVQTALRATKTRAGAAMARGVQPKLVIIPGGTCRLVYKVMLPLGINPMGRWHLVDAISGKHLGYRRGIIMDGHHWRKGVQP